MEQTENLKGILAYKQVWRQKDNTPKCFIIKTFTRKFIRGVLCNISDMGTVFNNKEKNCNI